MPWSIPPSGVARESSGPGGPLSYLLPVDGWNTCSGAAASVGWPEGWPAESQSSDSVSKLSLDASTSVGPPTEFEPPARLGEAPARQAVLKRHTQARANKAWQFYSAQTTDVAVVMAGANPSTSSTERSRSRL